MKSRPFPIHHPKVDGKMSCYHQKQMAGILVAVKSIRFFFSKRNVVNERDPRGKFH